MKVLVNAMTSKMGGAKSVINSFIENISSFDGNEFFFMVYKGSIRKDILERLPQNVIVNESLIGDMNHIRRFFWYQFSLPRFIRRNKFDCMINLTNYGPLRPGCRHILLLHNPKHVSDEIRNNLGIKGRIRLWIEDSVFRLSLKGTDKLVVQTNYMKEGVAAKFGFDARNIAVIPNCPDLIDRKKYDEELESKLRGFIGGEKNVLACVTLYDRHKNLERLLKAVKVLKEKKRVRFKLILTVDRKEGEGAGKLLDLIKELEIEDYILSVGNISHAVIYQILDKADALVLPSYAESLGLPFVEAMSFGLPVIAADLGFAHDVCGPAALYFMYDDENDLADKIEMMFSDHELYGKLKEESIKRSSLFNGRKTVEEYLRLLC